MSFLTQIPALMTDIINNKSWNISLNGPDWQSDLSFVNFLRITLIKQSKIYFDHQHWFKTHCFGFSHKINAYYSRYRNIYYWRNANFQYFAFFICHGVGIKEFNTAGEAENTRLSNSCRNIYPHSMNNMDLPTNRRRFLCCKWPHIKKKNSGKHTTFVLFPTFMLAGKDLVWLTSSSAAKFGNGGMYIKAQALPVRSHGE